MIRVSGERGNDTRIELRSPDSASNPYLVCALCLSAGFDGSRRKIDPPAAVGAGGGVRNERPEYLPSDLGEAIELFEESAWIREVLGEEFCSLYLEAKKKQWIRYSRQVTEWEINEYLYRI